MEKAGELHNYCNVKDGILYVAINGDQTDESIRQVGEEARSIIANSTGETQLVDMLIDTAGVTGHNAAARKQAGHYLDIIPCRRVGLYGADLILKSVINLIIKGTGIQHRVMVFNTEAEAKQWLNSQN